MAKLTIDGLDEIRRAFKLLPTKVAKKVIRAAIRQSLKPVLATAKDLAPVDTGVLKGNIKLRAAARRRKGSIALEVRVGPGDFKGDQFYAAFIEYGTVKMPARPFMRPAYEVHKDTAKAEAITLIREGIDRELKALL